MATMSYNGINLGEVRTATYRIENVYDSSGLDRVWQKITIEVNTILNLEWCASSKAAATPIDATFPATTLGIPGDRMPISLERLRHTLQEPRKRLLYRIGNDLVLDSPPPLPDGSVPTRDCDNGPTPEIINLTQIIGDVTAILSFRITTYVNDCSNYVVSNRWRMTHDINEFGYVTRVTTGEAVLRADFMSLVPTMSVDSFRKEFFVEATTPLQRDGIQAIQSEDGKTLYYTLTDVMTTYTITTPGVVRVDGNVSFGSEMAIGANETEFLERIWDMGTSFIWDVPKKVFAKIPKGHAGFVVRVSGRRDSTLFNLYLVALSIVTDRFAYAFGRGTLQQAPIAKLYLTLPIGSHDEPYVEIKGNIYLKNLTLANLMGATGSTGFAVGSLVNFSYDFGSGLNWSQTADRRPHADDRRQQQRDRVPLPGTLLRPHQGDDVRPPDGPGRTAGLLPAGFGNGRDAVRQSQPQGLDIRTERVVSVGASQAGQSRRSDMGVLARGRARE